MGIVFWELLTRHRLFFGPDEHDVIRRVRDGVVPPQDYDQLYAAGAAAIFPPGTVIADAAIELLDKLKGRLGHNSKNAAAG